MQILKPSAEEHKTPDKGHQINSQRRKLGKLDLEDGKYHCTRCGHERFWIKNDGRIQCTRCKFDLRQM